MEAKKLRDLMKKEKEKRAGEQSRARAPVRPNAAAVAPSASVRATAGRPAPTPVASRVVQQAAAAEKSAVSAPATSPESCREAHQPPAKDLRNDPAAVPEGVPAAKKPRADVDAKLMPPPSIPAVPAKLRAPHQVQRGPDAAGPTSQQQRESASAAQPVPSTTIDSAMAAAPVEELSLVAPSVLQAAAPDQTEPSDANVEDENPSGLPEGFFDNPDEEAKVRGVEAPTERAKRELEEGLKRFEREMVVEQERAEETRHELDEEKFEEVTAEERDFQSDLHGRLQALRQQAAKLKADAKADEAQGHDSVMQDVTAEDEDDDSGSDVDFDWRAKGFG